MLDDPEPDFPKGTPDESELFLRWLRYLRSAVIRKVDGLSESDARKIPIGGVTPLIGIVNHLTHVEWRWIDGAMLGAPTSHDDAEFTPGPELTVPAAIAAYRARGAATDSAVWSIASLSEPTKIGDGTDLRWVLLHLINETARHAGHADVTRQLLDGTTGE